MVGRSTGSVEGSGSGSGKYTMVEVNVSYQSGLYALR